MGPRNSTAAPASRHPRGDLHEATPARAAAIAAELAKLWPDAVVELDHKNAYELLVATILAAQSTDKMINTVTPSLFAKYPDAQALAAVADPAEVEPMIFSTGFYRNKAKAIVGMARAIVERHGGKVPETMAELVELPGVARKTANVVLGSALGKNEGVVVDTHVSRLAPRLGLTTQTDPVKIEQDLMALLPRDQWSIFAHRLIWHGRRVCFARKPDCEHCALAPLCPSAGLDAAQMPPLSDGPPKPSRAQQAKAAAERKAADKPGAKPVANAAPAKAAPAKPAANAKPGKSQKPAPPAKTKPAANAKPGKSQKPAPPAKTKPAARVQGKR